jgi:GntP family gluconate:H+ symporter
LTQSDWLLIGLAIAAVGVLVALVTRVKINAFIALFAAALIVGAGSGTPMLAAVGAFSESMGKTLGGTAAIIGLGTMLGKLLLESRGAEVLAKSFIAFFGPKRIAWCVMALALVVGLTTWFPVGLLMLLPILQTLTRESGKPFLVLALPMLACLSVMHGVMPPHPGPILAINNLNADTGKVLLWGFALGIPTALVAGPIFARWAVKHVPVDPPQMAIRPPNAALIHPQFGLTLLTMLLPIGLMLTATVAELVIPAPRPPQAVATVSPTNPASPDAASAAPVSLLSNPVAPTEDPNRKQIREAAQFIGNPTIALVVSVLFATWSLGTRCGFTRPQLLKFTEESISAVGMTLLVVGAGGGFAGVLKLATVDKAMGHLAVAMNLPPMLYGWLVSAFVRVATGSATVAIITASTLLVPVCIEHPEANKELIIVAIGCGSLFLSHLNDGGFWIVKDCLGLSISQTLRTWTLCETIVGLAGLGFALLANTILNAFQHS